MASLSKCLDLHGFSDAEKNTLLNRSAALGERYKHLSKQQREIEAVERYLWEAKQEHDIFMAMFSDALPSQSPIEAENTILATRPEQLLLLQNGEWFVNQNPHISSSDTMIPTGGNFATKEDAIEKAQSIIYQAAGRPQEKIPQKTKGLKFNDIAYETDEGAFRPGKQGTGRLINLKGRIIALIDVNGIQIPFYISTGRGGKETVEAGKWYPFFGMGKETGWFNKGSEELINDYYGSPKLKEISEKLDADIGDVRSDESIPKVPVRGIHKEAINKGLSPVESGNPGSLYLAEQEIRKVIARIERSEPIREAPKSETKQVITKTLPGLPERSTSFNSEDRRSPDRRAWDAYDAAVAQGDTEKAKEIATRLAYKDRLTGLTRREGWEHNEAEGKHAQYAQRFFLNLDNFHDTNTELGHEGGDIVLAYFGKLLRFHLGEGAEAARWGGDEFVGAGNADLESRLKALQEDAADTVIPIDLKSGEHRDQIGIKLSFGIGKDYAEAYSENTRAKEERKAAGLRHDRETAIPRSAGEKPAGAVEVRTALPATAQEAGVGTALPPSMAKEFGRPDVPLGQPLAEMTLDDLTDELAAGNAKIIKYVKRAIDRLGKDTATDELFNKAFGKAIKNKTRPDFLRIEPALRALLNGESVETAEKLVKLAEPETALPAVPRGTSKAAETTALPPAVPIAIGRKVQAKTERGTSVDTQFEVMKAADLVASHSSDLTVNPAYPKELQPRDRGRAASELQISNIMQRLEPEFLGESPKASEGAPIIGDGNVVESGNGRVIAIKRLYERGEENAKRYRQWLMDNADRFGLDRATIEKAEAPVLVRRRLSEVDREAFVKEASEQALSDSKRLTPEVLAEFSPGEDGNLLTMANREFIKSFMRVVVGQAEAGRYLQANGSISQEGVMRMRNAIFAKAYGESDVLEKLAESTDSNVKNITNAMLMTAADFVKLRRDIELGERYALDISGDISAAVRKLSDLRDKGEPVKSYIDQIEIAPEISPLAKQILTVVDQMKRSAHKIAAVFRSYVEAVESLGSPQQEDIFGGTKAPSAMELFGMALGRAEGLAAEGPRYLLRRNADASQPPLFTSDDFRLEVQEAPKQKKVVRQETLGLGLTGADLKAPERENKPVTMDELPLGKATNEAADRRKQVGMFEGTPPAPAIEPAAAIPAETITVPIEKNEIARRYARKMADEHPALRTPEAHAGYIKSSTEYFGKVYDAIQGKDIAKLAEALRAMDPEKYDKLLNDQREADEKEKTNDTEKELQKLLADRKYNFNGKTVTAKEMIDAALADGFTGYSEKKRGITTVVTLAKGNHSYEFKTTSERTYIKRRLEEMGKEDPLNAEKVRGDERQIQTGGSERPGGKGEGGRDLQQPAEAGTETGDKRKQVTAADRRPSETVNSKGEQKETPEININARHSLPVSAITTPAGAIKADAYNSRADSSIWFHQGGLGQLGFDATVKIGGEQTASEATKSSFAELKAARAAGWKPVNMRAGSYGTIWTLQKDDVILTRAGAAALASGKFQQPEGDRSEAGYDGMVDAQAKYSTRLAEWLATLPESTMASSSALGSKLSTTGIGDWAEIVRDKNEVRLWFKKDGKRDVSLAAPTQDHLLHEVVALAQQARDNKDAQKYEWGYGARDAAKERAKAGMSVYDALKSDGFIKEAPATEGQQKESAKAAPVPEEKSSEPIEAPPSILVAQHEDFETRLYDGKSSLDEFKAQWQTVRGSREQIIEELSDLKKDELLKMIGGMLAQRYKSDRKEIVVKAAYDSMLDTFTLGKSVSYMVGGNMERAHENAVSKMVDATTDDDLKTFADKVAESRKARRERIEATKKAVENPQTLDDFRAYMRFKTEGPAQTTEREAYLSLTPEQRRSFDALDAEEGRARRTEADRERRTTVTAAGAATEGKIIETKHTRDGYDLFVVQAAERVDREIYNQWNTTAKRLGGWYSSFRGNGATPGFQFKTKEAAQAFLEFIGGKTDAAKAAVESRRDAFEDDRSQTAVERLTEMADRLDERADEKLSQDRRVNTDRRARMAASAEAAAESDKALAATMRNIAKAIESGEAKQLDRVRQKAQVEMLRGMVRSAASDERAAKYPTYAEQEKHRHDPPTAESVDHAKFPTFTAYRGDLARLGRELEGIDGAKQLGQRILKIANDVTDEYLKFARENLHRVSTFTRKDGEAAVFASRKGAEDAIRRSGFKGRAIVLPFKRGQNIIVMGPEMAKEHGLWQGDADKRFTLSPDFGMELVEKVKSLRKGRERISLPWVFERAAEERQRLKAMGIETASEFRSALREFVGLAEAQKQPDKVKELERSMVGRQKDGLDFFPTPEGQADEMVTAADIKEGMRILEPSAGMGHIAERIRDAGVEPDVAEFSSGRRELLDAKGFNVVGQDFMDMRIDKPEDGYDRILMNPPFSDRRDAQHVQHAYTLLKPGGRIVALMGEGVFFGQDAKAKAFREWLGSVGGTSEKLEPGTFNDPALPVNTGVNARQVVIDKPTENEQAGKGEVLFSNLRQGDENADLHPGDNTKSGRDKSAEGSLRAERGEQRDIDEDVARAGEGGPARVDDIRRITELEDAIRKQTGTAFPAGSVLLAEEPSQSLDLGKIAEVFGKRVIYIKNTHPDMARFDGAVLPDKTDVIYLSVDAKDPHIAILGHEMFHAMASESPDLARQFFDLIKGELRGVNAEMISNAVDENGVQIVSEHLSDIVGSQFTREGFWEKLAEKDPSLFERVAKFITDFLRQIKNAMLSMRVSDYYVGNIDKIETAASTVMAKYARRKQIDAENPDIRFSLRRAESIDDITAKWAKEGVTIDAFDYRDAKNTRIPRQLLSINRIEVDKDKRKHGLGTMAMQDLTDFADANGLRIELSPDKSLGATSVGRLKAFYKRFGFVENSGRNKDFRTSATMYRRATEGAKYSLRELPVPTFYSQLEKSASEHLPERVTADGLRAFLKRFKFRQDDVVHSGIEDFIAENEGKKISKPDLMAYIGEKQAKIVPVEFKGKDTSGDYEAPAEWGDWGAMSRDEWEREIPANEADAKGTTWYDWYRESEGDQEDRAKEYDEEYFPQSWEAYRAEMLNKLRRVSGEETEGTTKFSNWKIPGESIPGSYVEHFETVPGELAPVESYDGLSLESYISKYNLEKQFTKNPRQVKAQYNQTVKDQLNWQDGHTPYAEVKNPIVRWRGDGRTTADGHKTFFIHEIQAPSAENQAKMPKWAQKRWREIGLKSALDYAVKNGYDSLSLASGEQVAGLYDLSKQVDAVRVTPELEKGKYAIEVVKAGDRSGSWEQLVRDVPAEKIADHVGKDIARKVGEGQTVFHDVDLKVGAEGLRKLYDRDLPGILNDMGKKWGARVVVIKLPEIIKTDRLPGGTEGGTYQESPEMSVPSLNIPPSMRDSVLTEGQPLFSLRDSDLGKIDRYLPATMTKERTLFWLDRLVKDGILKASDVTDSLAKSWVMDHEGDTIRRADLVEFLRGKSAVEVATHKPFELNYQKVERAIKEGLGDSFNVKTAISKLRAMVEHGILTQEELDRSDLIGWLESQTKPLATKADMMQALGQRRDDEKAFAEEAQAARVSGDQKRVPAHPVLAQERAVEDVRDLRQKVERDDRLDAAHHRRVSQMAAARTVTAGQRKVADLFTKPLGLRAVFVENALFEAVVIDKTRIFLASDISLPQETFRILAHEFGHSIGFAGRSNAPVKMGYRKFIADIKSVITPEQIASYLKTRNIVASNEAAMWEEYGSDILADAMRDVRFYEALAQKSPTSFQKLVNWFIEAFKKMGLIGDKVVASDYYTPEQAHKLINASADLVAAYPEQQESVPADGSWISYHPKDPAYSIAGKKARGFAEAQGKFSDLAGEEEARRVAYRADMTAEERMGTPYERSDLEPGETRIVRTGGGVAESRTKQPQIGDSMSWQEFGDYLTTLPLKDTFGKLDYKEVKEMSAAADRWTLRAIDPVTKKPVDVKVDTKYPIIIGEDGDVLDGARRLNAALNRGDKAILAWVGSDEQPSNLNAFQREQVATKEFKKWFKGSQIVDKNGDPEVLYHSTNAENNFSIFDTKSGELGGHFGNTDQAHSFVERGSRERVIPVYLHISNPLRLNDNGGFSAHEVVGQLVDAKLISQNKADQILDMNESQATQAMQAVIEQAGHDGVVYLNRREGADFFGPDGYTGEHIFDMTDDEVRDNFPEAADSYIAFHANQVKSAVSNEGDFSKKSPDIRYSLRHEPSGLPTDTAERQGIWDHIREAKYRVMLNIPKNDMTTMDRLLSLPWWLAKKFPAFRKVLNVELLREEHRSELQKDLLQSPTKIRAGQDHEIMQLTNDKAEDVLKLIVQSDKEQRVMPRAELEKAGMDAGQIRAYYNWRASMQKAWKLRLDTVQELIFAPYRDKPWFEDLKAVAKDESKLLVVMAKLTGEGEREEFTIALNDVKPLTKGLEEYRAEAGKVKFYFPRFRDDGDYVIRVRDDNGEVIHSERFRNSIQGKNIERRLMASMPGKTIEAKYEPRTPESMFQDVNDAALEKFVDRALDMMESGKKVTHEEAKDLRDSMFQAIATELKSRGFGSHYIQRVGGEVITGYKNEGAKQIFMDYMTGLSGYVSKQKASYEFYRVMDENFGTHWRGGKKTPDQIKLYEYARQYIKDMLRNQSVFDRYSGKFRSAAFTYYLLGNIKSAAVQFTQNFVTGIPMLAREMKLKNDKGAGRTYNKAMYDVARGNLTEDERTALHEAIDKGITTDQFIRDITARTEGTLKGAYGTAIKYLSMPFSGMEIFNRKSAFLAMYRVARKAGASHDEVFAKAKDFVYDTHFLMGKANMPEWARGESMGSSIARTGYTFRSFNHNYLLSLKHSLRGPEGRLALDVIGRSLVFLAMFGGAAAMPWLDDLLDEWEKLFGDPVRTKMRRALNRAGGDVLERFGMEGLPAVLGVNLSGSLKIGIPGLGGASNELMGVYSGLWTKAGNVAASLGRGDWLRALEYGLPAFAENPMKAVRMATSGATTPRGKIQYDREGKPIKLSPLEAAGQFFGFRPERTAIAQQERRVETNVMAHYRDFRDDIYAKYRMAKTAADRQAVMKKIMEYNRKVSKYRGAISPITRETLKRQMMQKPNRKTLLFERAIE